MAVMLLAGFGTLLKGLDWEAAVTLGAIGIAAWSQAGLFDRESGGDWLEWTDLGLGFAALLLFLTFGIFSHHLGTGVLEPVELGRLSPAGRAVPAHARCRCCWPSRPHRCTVLLRTPVHFAPPAPAEIDRRARRRTRRSVPGPRR